MSDVTLFAITVLLFKLILCSFYGSNVSKRIIFRIRIA